MKLVKLLISIVIPLIILLIPASAFPIEGLTVVEKRVIALFVLAALFWILEPIPIYATSVLIIVLELIMLSDNGLVFFTNSEGVENFGELLGYNSIFATFASPIILLFLGGFFLAMAATKFRLDQSLARIMLKPFGSKPVYVMLGLMLITAVFSMFMSNTATTAMMLSILAPVLALFPDGDKGKIAFALSIPVAANIGGMGTPIGTPPNAIALKYLTGENSISFGEWMSFGVPIVIVLLLISWLIINFMFKAETKSVILKITSKPVKNIKAKIVYITFIVTILLWLTDFLHGMNSYVVAMIPVAVFSALGIINKEDLKKMSWDVLWLVSGGIALGLAMEKTGLAAHLVSSIPFETFAPVAILIGGALLTLVMSNFMSHTATTNLLLPILAALGASIESLNAIGGIVVLVLAATLTSSVGMSLPISTPPNALAHGTGAVNTKDMARFGIIIGLIGVIITIGVAYLFQLFRI